MTLIVVSAVLVLVMLVLLASGLLVGASLILVALLGLFFADNLAPTLVFATSAWGTTVSFGLVALPLFIWMGEILFRTRVSSDLFEGLTPWLHRIPGGLLHVNILSCGLFAAVSGSSAATAATIGRMTLPELNKRGYDQSLAIGSLAGSGTLGFLIPPSLILIIYGIAAEVSIARLFLAGILPGLVLIALFMAFVMIKSLLARGVVTSALEKGELSKRASLKRLLPIFSLIAFIPGSIYSGLATPGEAAAIGVCGALLLAKMTGNLSWDSFIDSLMSACKTTSMIAFILIAASFLTMAMGFLQIPAQLAGWITVMDLTNAELLLMLTLMFVVLGLFLDGISVVLLTTSIILPVVIQSGIDLLWFGIYIVLVVEMSQITPPVGFNLFVLQNLTGRNILQIAKASFPFFLLILTTILVIYLFPELVIWPDL